MGVEGYRRHYLDLQSMQNSSLVDNFRVGVLGNSCTWDQESSLGCEFFFGGGGGGWWAGRGGWGFG